MAPRTHLTDLGCIACEELSELGAGKEGWLDTPNLSAAIDSSSLALANRSLVLLLNWRGNCDLINSPIKIKPSLSPIEGDITAIEKLFVVNIDKPILLTVEVGKLFDFGELNYVCFGFLGTQMIYPSRILRLRVRGTWNSLTPFSSSDELCVVMPGVIARFDGSDFQTLLQQWFQETESQFWDQRRQKREIDDMVYSYKRLPYQLWNVSKYGLCADAAITGVMPPPLMELQSSERYFCAVTIGEDAVISAYRLSEDRNRSLVGTILSKVVPAAFSTLSSFSKMIWRSEACFITWKLIPLNDTLAASSLTCLKDHPRKGEKLTLSPGGRLAAITDSFGRILLLDTQALLVVRIWKGYRDANCLFMEMLVNKDTTSSSTAVAEHSKSDYCLCLAIHAPRKGIIEVWQMRIGPRLIAIRCAKGSQILQPTSKFGSSSVPPSFVPLEVFLLNGDSGQLSVLNQSFHQ
ncbi:hypothetical protein Scep_027985 [Stephania cephalantha]|uniref:Rab3-GAP regulatory subunit N-terminal domain-containing protein n=1 Tax=Stephania cephalantha TaxID=152367 RepID=A0AAP0HHQ5_9MAGN